MRRVLMVLIALGIVGGIAAWYLLQQHSGGGSSNGTATTTSASPKIKLDMSIEGGFAYVYTNAQHMVEIGFMQSYTGSCNVTQLGVDLVVDKGDIVEPATYPANKTFDPTGAVVSFVDSTPAENQSLIVNGLGKPNSPYHPGNQAVESEWEDLQWVPAVTANGPSNPLASDWRTKVDGRVELKNGKIKGRRASDIVARFGTWDFKNEKNPNQIKFTQAITDRVEYTADLPGTELVINLPGAHSGVTKIRVKPHTGNSVSLALIGKHPSNAPHSIPIGTRIDHYCVFYQLMNPVPPKDEWLYPYFAGISAGAPSGGTGGSSSPGFYCAGDWF